MLKVAWAAERRPREGAVPLALRALGPPKTVPSTFLVPSTSGGWLARTRSRWVSDDGFGLFPDVTPSVVRWAASSA